MHVEEKIDFRSCRTHTVPRAAIRPRISAIKSTRDQGTHLAGKLRRAGSHRFHPAPVLHGLPFQRDTLALVQPSRSAILERRHRRCPRSQNTQSLRVDPSSRPPSRHSARLSHRDVRRCQRRAHAPRQIRHTPSLGPAHRKRPRRPLRMDHHRPGAQSGIPLMTASFHDLFTHREHSDPKQGITIVRVQPPTRESWNGSHVMMPWVTCDACLTGAGIARISQSPILSITITASHLNGAESCALYL
jgi:hypothetical protein